MRACIQNISRDRHICIMIHACICMDDKHIYMVGENKYYMHMMIDPVYIPIITYVGV